MTEIIYNILFNVTDFINNNYYFSIFSFIYYLTLVIIFFSSIGCVVGFLAYRWDTQSTVSNFFISPINFLSGTFFSINTLPENFKLILIYNPYYYIISFFRDSFYIKTEINLYLNFIILIFIFFIFFISGYIFYKGYNVIK